MLPNSVDNTLISDKPYKAELWACGFNAWGQVEFDGEERNAQIREKRVKGVAYEDVRTWKKVLVDEKGLAFMRGGYNSVVGEFSTKI